MRGECGHSESLRLAPLPSHGPFFYDHCAEVTGSGGIVHLYPLDSGCRVPAVRCREQSMSSWALLSLCGIIVVHQSLSLLLYHAWWRGLVEWAGVRRRAALGTPCVREREINLACACAARLGVLMVAFRSSPSSGLFDRGCAVAVPGRTVVVIIGSSFEASRWDQRKASNAAADVYRVSCSGHYRENRRAITIVSG